MNLSKLIAKSSLSEEEKAKFEKVAMKYEKRPGFFTGLIGLVLLGGITFGAYKAGASFEYVEYHLRNDGTILVEKSWYWGSVVDRTVYVYRGVWNAEDESGNRKLLNPEAMIIR